MVRKGLAKQQRFQLGVDVGVVYLNSKWLK